MAASADVWPNDAGFDTDYQELAPVDLPVKGSIPHYAAGVLYRTGPLGYKAKTDHGNIWAAKHWFDGFSCVHRFQIDFPDSNGPPTVQYRSRRTVDEHLEVIRKEGTLKNFTFGAKRDPCENFFKKVMGVFFAKRNTQNIGVTLSANLPGNGASLSGEKPLINGHTNKIETLHVKTDAPTVKRIDPETLEPLGIAHQTSLHPDLNGEFSAAHAKSDPVTGDVFNFNLKFGHKNTYRIFRTSASTGQTDILATFVGTPAYIHSLFLTDNYVILCVFNSHVLYGGLSILYHKNILDAIAPFDPKSHATWYVVDRKHGKGIVATYESQPFFCFHTVNAWEEPSSQDPTKTDIITEFSMFENTTVLHRFYYDNLLASTENNKWNDPKKRQPALPMNAQFRLSSVNAVSNSTKPLPVEVIFIADKSVSVELPTINPVYRNRRHRYTYGVIDRMKSSFMDGLAKFDNTTQKSIIWEQEGHTPGEAIFVADPNGTEEDDGVLLSVVLDGHVERSYLLVLDAKTMKEVGRAEVPGPVSFGFHGLYKGQL